MVYLIENIQLYSNLNSVSIIRPSIIIKREKYIALNRALNPGKHGKLDIPTESHDPDERIVRIQFKFKLHLTSSENP